MRLLWIILVILLTLYAPIELTRAIVVTEVVMKLHPEIPVWQFWAEVISIWSLYLVGIGIVYWRIR